LLGFSIIIMFAVMNLFYYSRVFAGGDAKLLFAMTVFFIGQNFSSTFVNILVFTFILMIVGSFYGIIFSIYFYCRNFKKVNLCLRSSLKTRVYYFTLFFSVILIILGNFNFWFYFFGILLLVFPFLFIFSKCLEGCSMIEEISGKELREGDWLVEDVRVGKRVIRADWDGLSNEDIIRLRNKKKVKIKKGIPFVPVFFIAFLVYSFSFNLIFNFFRV
jgi:prepilin signal peptidase PulO-like enzyme (type II secretory pathway)